MLDKSRQAWEEYTRRKNAWQFSHPKSTPDQYAAACRRIAEELGL